MSFKPKFKISKVEGKTNFYDKEKFKQHVDSLPDNDYYITIDKNKKDRSLRQNAYYWGVVIELIAKHMGHPKDEYDFVHQKLASDFLGFKKEVLGREFWIVPSTASLTTVQFEDYLSTLRMFAAQTLGVNVPEPNEVDY